MQQEFCPRESEVLDAARGGPLHGELAQHASSCNVCEQALMIAEFLSQPAELAEVPSWGYVYWKAEIEARRVHAEQALRPVKHFEIVAAVVLALAGCGAGVAFGSVLVPLAAGMFAVLMFVALWATRKLLA